MKYGCTTCLSELDYFRGWQWPLVVDYVLEVASRGWNLLTVLKSEIKPSTRASFHNIQAPKVVIGLISNHFHEFW